MSLSKFLHRLHEEKCNFRIPSSEVRDIESSVYECLSAILQKGQSLDVTRHKEDEVKTYTTYRELFSVEEILPVGSFFEKTKIILPNEFDFNIKLNVGEIDIHPGCRPGRVQVSFESSRQKWLERLGKLFCTMIEEALKTMTCDEKNIQRDSGTLHSTSNYAGQSQAKLKFKWKGKNSEFDIHVDVMPSIPCTNIFIAELEENDHFPSNFHQLVKDHPCYLVPKPCSPNCQKCFHVSFAQAEHHLMQSLNEGHRQCYRVLKLLLVHSILHSYQVKMAILDHVYNLKCQSKEFIDEQCVLDVLTTLLNNYNELRMPTFFLNNCCVITRDGEGTQRYLDYLVNATDLDVSTLPVIDLAVQYSYKNYDWLDMFAWYEFQRRCLSLMIDVLRFYSQVGIKRGLSYRRMFAALAALLVKETGGISVEEISIIGRPTMREWRDKVPNFVERVFIPAFPLILDEIQVILQEKFVVPGVWFTPPIQICLPCPVMGLSQGSLGSTMWRTGDLGIRQGAMCYFAQLKGSSWCPVAFGKMTFIENFEQSFKAFMSNRMSLYEGGPTAQLVRGSSLNHDADDASKDEIPDFEGPFHYNVRYDGEAFQENIASCWHYKHCLIRFLLNRMAAAILLRSMFAR